MNRKLSDRERVLLTVTVLAALFAVFWLGFYIPLQRDIKNIQYKIEESKKEKLQLTDKESSLEELEQKAKEEMERATLLEQYIVHDFDDSKFILLLSEIVDPYAERSQVSFSDPVQGEEYDSFTVSIHMITSYPELKKILAGLNSMIYPNRIDRMDIQSRTLQKASELTSKPWSIEERVTSLPSVGSNNAASQTNNYDLSVEMVVTFFADNIGKSTSEVLQNIDKSEIGKKNIFH